MDEINAEKGKKTLVPYEQRKEIVENVKCVDFVIPETCWEQKIEDVKTHSIDVFATIQHWQQIQFLFMQNKYFLQID